MHSLLYSYMFNIKGDLTKLQFVKNPALVCYK